MLIESCHCFLTSGSHNFKSHTRHHHLTLCYISCGYRATSKAKRYPTCLTYLCQPHWRKDGNILVIVGLPLHFSKTIWLNKIWRWWPLNCITVSYKLDHTILRVILDTNIWILVTFLVDTELQERQREVPHVV